MKSQKIISTLNFGISRENMKKISAEVKEIAEEIGREIKKSRIKAEVFVGGSFAKGTLMKREKYDIDIFVRFDEKHDSPSLLLKNILKKVSKKVKMKLNEIHGSRDYFALRRKNITFEIVPVKKISKPEQAQNSTDLSYFHVEYVANKIRKNPKLAEEILLAKAFCRALRVYGAESWIHGFSGYALECLIINYGSFKKMLMALAKVKEQLVLDPEKRYKNKMDILIELNESKRKGPIILIDPTYGQRNVCSALETQTFLKFQEAAKNFLKNPNEKFFYSEKIDRERLEKKALKNNGDFVEIVMKTGKQEGDIAGAKLEKFYRFICRETEKFYKIEERVFDFNEGREAKIYLIVKPNKKVFQKGPPIKMVHHAVIFKSRHKDAFVKRGKLYSPIKAKRIGDFLKKWKNKNEEQIRIMGVDEINML